MCPRRDCRPLIALLAAASVTLAGQRPQPHDQPTFRGGVHVVEVDARVFDRTGRFVTDLRRDEFELLEDGVPQQLQSMFLVDQEVAPQTPAASTDPNTAPSTRPAARHTWIFLFDLNHLSPGAGFDRARDAVEAFIRNRFREGDLAGVIAGSRMVNNRLTSVREELAAAVKSVKPLSDSRTRQIELTREWPRLRDEEEALLIANQNAEALRRAVARACTDDQDACGRASPDLEILSKARRLASDLHRATLQTLSAINGLASGLAKMPGPKTIVFLSDGFVAAQVETTLRQAVGQAARAGARIYAIDVRGLNRGRGAGIIDQSAVSDEAGGPASVDMVEDAPNSLAVDTGGLMIRNENNIGRGLDTIAADTNRYYVLAYQPANTTFDGKYRRIEVRVKRAEVRVRARRGYLALEPSRMLLPEPIKTTPERTEPAAAPHAPVAKEAAAPPTPATAAGTVIGTPAAAPGVVKRLRPDAKEQVAALSRGEVAGAGEFATKGWEAYQRGDVEAALPLLTEAAARADVRPWVLYALGLSQMAVGRPADAAAAWERLRQAAPDFEAVYIDLAATYVQLSELTRALAVLRDAAKRWPADPEIHNAIGVIHVRRGALDEAIATFTKATTAAPEEALAQFNLARTYELRYSRARHYVSSQARWVAPEDDRRKAVEHYEAYLRMGGPYATEATEAMNRLKWEASPKP